MVDEITNFYVYVCVIVKMCKRKKKMSANKCIFLQNKTKRYNNFSCETQKSFVKSSLQ